MLHINLTRKKRTELGKAKVENNFQTFRVCLFLWILLGDEQVLYRFYSLKSQQNQSSGYKSQIILSRGIPKWVETEGEHALVYL